MAKRISQTKWRVICSLTVSGLLGACTTTPPTTWSKPGATITVWQGRQGSSFASMLQTCSGMDPG